MKLKNNEKIDLGMFENPQLLLQAIQEDKLENKGKKSTEATHYSYLNFEEYFSYLCMKKLIAEGYTVGAHDWCYAGVNVIEESYYKVCFVKYMNDGYEVIEFYVSQFEFNQLFPSTYATMIPLILRADGSYVPGNTINESIYRVYYTDNRGIEHADIGDVYHFHFLKEEKFKAKNWYRIVDSNMYESE